MQKIAPKKKIAFRAFGGKAKAVFWHLGVWLALEERGFRFSGGLRREKGLLYGGRLINPIIGSSAGAFFAVHVARGYSLMEILESYEKGRKGRLRPIIPREIFCKNKLMRRVFGEERFVTDGLERYLRDEILKGSNSFEELAAELYILATNSSTGLIEVFGEKESGVVNNCYVYKKGVAVSEAAAASMALPTVYKPRKIGSCTYMDGEIPNPFIANVAQDAGSDLIFASCPHQLLENSNIKDYAQRAIDISYESKRKISVENRRKKRLALEALSRSIRKIVPKGKLEEILEEQARILEYKSDVDIIYIMPSNDYELEKIDRFDVSYEAMKKVFNRAHYWANKILENYEFEAKI